MNMKNGYAEIDNEYYVYLEQGKNHEDKHPNINLSSISFKNLLEEYVEDYRVKILTQEQIYKINYANIAFTNIPVVKNSLIEILQFQSIDLNNFFGLYFLEEERCDCDENLYCEYCECRSGVSKCKCWDEFKDNINKEGDMENFFSRYGFGGDLTYFTINIVSFIRNSKTNIPPWRNGYYLDNLSTKIHKYARCLHLYVLFLKNKFQ